MYIIIMGGGRVGLSLANLLIEDGFDITLMMSHYVQKLQQNLMRL